jgi:hypothetical protein
MKGGKKKVYDVDLSSNVPLTNWRTNRKSGIISLMCFWFVPGSGSGDGWIVTWHPDCGNEIGIIA